MQTAGMVLLLSVSVLLVSSCKNSDVPQGTLGVALSTPGKGACANQAIPTMANGKECDIEPGDIFVNPKYFNALLTWGIDKQKEINNLKARLNTCH